VTHIDRDYTDVTINTPHGPATITGTDNHPYWDATTHQWTPAHQLHTGDQLQSTNGTRATITAIRNYTTTMVTYDLTINTLHTYYVEARNIPVLVHNCDEDVPSIEDHVTPRHTSGGAEADASKSLFDDSVDLEQLAEGSAGQIGARQATTGNIRYFLRTKDIIRTDRFGNPTNIYTIIRDGRDGELITMHPGLPSDIMPGP
jgi:hypothetical protein